MILSSSGFDTVFFTAPLEASDKGYLPGVQNLAFLRTSCDCQSAHERPWKRACIRDSAQAATSNCPPWKRFKRHSHLPPSQNKLANNSVTPSSSICGLVISTSPQILEGGAFDALEDCNLNRSNRRAPCLAGRQAFTPAFAPTRIGVHCLFRGTYRGNQSLRQCVGEEELKPSGSRPDMPS